MLYSDRRPPSPGRGAGYPRSGWRGGAASARSLGLHGEAPAHARFTLQPGVDRRIVRLERGGAHPGCVARAAPGVHPAPGDPDAGLPIRRQLTELALLEVEIDVGPRLGYG